MERSRWRAAASAAALVVAVALAGAGPARATVSVEVSGATLAVTGTAGTDRPVIRWRPPADGASPGYSEIYDFDGITGPLPAGCAALSQDTVRCEDGGTAPLLTDLDLRLGMGFDEPRIDDCYDTMVVDSGEGGGTMTIPKCPDGTATTFSFASGAGADTLTGAVGADSTIDVELGAGDDYFSGDSRAALNGVVRGGPGNDQLDGSAGAERLLGEGGDDFLRGKEGDDALDGGEGDDRLAHPRAGDNDPDPGADDYRGGPGTDVLDLDRHAAGMTISLDEAANDGSPGEGDNVHADIEQINGTRFADAFTGSAAADRFNGGDGPDTIRGGGGDDVLEGGVHGNDRIFGDAGDDRLVGGPDDDTVEGGPGADTMIGDCGPFCEWGHDTMLARDGEGDRVECGVGADTVQADAVDVVSQDGREHCETVDRQGQVAGPPPPPPPPPCTGLAGCAPAGTFAVGSVGRPSIAKGAKATVSCPAACTFTVTVRLGAKGARRYRLGRRAIVLGTARGSLPTAGAEQVTVRLTAKARRRLRRARKVPATLRATMENAAGKATTRSRAIVLRR